jgi:hypothetical protein
MRDAAEDIAIGLLGWREDLARLIDLALEHAQLARPADARAAAEIGMIAVALQRRQQCLARLDIERIPSIRDEQVRGLRRG